MIYLIYEKGSLEGAAIVQELVVVFDAVASRNKSRQINLPGYIKAFFEQHSYSIGKVIVLESNESSLVIRKGHGKQIDRLPVLVNIQDDKVDSVLYLSPPFMTKTDSIKEDTKRRTTDEKSKNGTSTTKTNSSKDSPIKAKRSSPKASNTHSKPVQKSNDSSNRSLSLKLPQSTMAAHHTPIPSIVLSTGGGMDNLGIKGDNSTTITHDPVATDSTKTNDLMPTISTLVESDALEAIPSLYNANAPTALTQEADLEDIDLLL